MRLQKPDLVPPTSPLFDGYDISEEGVALRWIRSSSLDVVKHLLYRRPENRPDDWQLLLADTDTLGDYGHFLDTMIAPRAHYVYRLVAMDDAANFSEKEETLVLHIPDFRTLPPVYEFTLAPEAGPPPAIGLQWKFQAPRWLKHPPVFAIFRAVDDSGFYFYQMTEEGSTSFTDRQVDPGTTYHYLVKALDPETEIEGPPSAVQSVTLPPPPDH